ncbi:alkaline phosphatase family protein, partial [Vibrio parahaemolyticus V-223/04]
LSVKTEI